MNALVAQNAVYLALDLLLVGWLGWGVAGAATAASAGQYIGFIAMASALVQRKALDLEDLRILPSPQRLGSTLLTGLALAVCIGSVATSVLSATSMASGSPSSSPPFLTGSFVAHAGVSPSASAPSLPQLNYKACLLLAGLALAVYICSAAISVPSAPQGPAGGGGGGGGLCLVYSAFRDDSIMQIVQRPTLCLHVRQAGSAQAPVGLKWSMHPHKPACECAHMHPTSSHPWAAC